MSAGIKCGMPRQVAIAINDLLDACAEIKPGQQVLIVAASDGLTGGYNIVDETTVAWIQAAVQQRGAWPSVLWVDIPERLHGWRVPPVVKAALAGADVMINHAFDLPFEELYEFRGAVTDNRVIMVRNMATTAGLLASNWAQTPYELVSEIRIRTAQLFEQGLRWTLTHPNGTNLNGRISPPIPPGRRYADRRTEGFYRPFPEGVFSPINLLETEGSLVFEKTSPWWARYIGIPCHFDVPVRLTVENNRIKRFEGASEAKAMEQFITQMANRVGDSMYETFALHGGVHPHAKILPHQCANGNYREFIEHHHSSNLHLHLGVVSAGQRTKYPYFVHITGDLQGATLRVGDKLIYDHGRLTTLDLDEIKSISARYSDRPCI
jgi:hypothetical protein